MFQKKMMVLKKIDVTPFCILFLVIFLMVGVQDVYPDIFELDTVYDELNRSVKPLSLQLGVLRPQVGSNREAMESYRKINTYYWKFNNYFDFFDFSLRFKGETEKKLADKYFKANLDYFKNTTNKMLKQLNAKRIILEDDSLKEPLLESIKSVEDIKEWLSNISVGEQVQMPNLTFTMRKLEKWRKKYNHQLNIIYESIDVIMANPQNDEDARELYKVVEIFALQADHIEKILDIWATAYKIVDNDILN